MNYLDGSLLNCYIDGDNAMIMSYHEEQIYMYLRKWNVNF